MAYCLHFIGVDECALNAFNHAVARDQHVAAAYQLIGSGAVENGARVVHLCDAECHSSGEVGLDHAGDHVDTRSLCGKDHVDTDGTRFCRNTGDWCLHFFAGGQDQIGKLVDDHDYVGQVAVAFFRIKTSGYEFLVVLFDPSHSGF